MRQARDAVYVACPGAWPELREAGKGYFERGRLRAFLTTFQASRNPVVRAAGRLPGSAGAYIQRETKRRVLGDMDAATVEHAALPDLLQAAAFRVSGRSPLHAFLIDRRDAAFDRAVARSLRPDAGVFIGQAGACRRSLAAARRLGLETVVNWNIQHWRTAEREYAIECRDRPAWAGLFTFARFSPALIAAWKEELAIADRVLAPSTVVRDSLVEHGVPAERIRVVPYGVDTARYTPPAELKGPPARLRVVSVGELSQRKGLSFLFGVARLLPDVQFDVVGWNVKKLPEAPPANVALHPNVPDIVPYLRAADLFFFPSLLDGFGLVVLQAMACGLPAICSTNAGAVDVIDEGVDGSIVPARDVAAMCDAIAGLRDDRVRLGEMRLAARRKAEAYPWRRFHDGMAAAFDGSGSYAVAPQQSRSRRTRALTS